MTLLELICHDIFVHLLCKWIGSAKDLINLDSSLSNYLLRARYLKCLQETPCGISAPISINFLRKLKEFQTWCHLRQLKIQNLSINKLSLVGDQTLLCSFKRLTTVTFHGPSYLCYKVLLSAIAQLHNLKSLKFQSITCLVDLLTLCPTPLNEVQEPMLSNITELTFTRVHLLTTYYAAIEDTQKYELFYASLLNCCPKLTKLGFDDSTGLSYKVIKRLLHARAVFPELEVFSYYVRSNQELVGKNETTAFAPLTTLKASISNSSKLHTIKVGISDDYDDPSYLTDVYFHLYTIYSSPSFPSYATATTNTTNTIATLTSPVKSRTSSFSSTTSTLSTGTTTSSSSSSYYTSHTTIKHVDLDVDDLTSTHRDLLVCTMIPYSWQSLVTCRLVAIRSHLDPILMTLAVVCIHLERFELSHCLHVSEESFHMFTTGRLHALKSLILYALCNMETKDMNAFCAIEEEDTNDNDVVEKKKNKRRLKHHNQWRSGSISSIGDSDEEEEVIASTITTTASHNTASNSEEEGYLYHHLQECIIHHCTKLTGNSFISLVTTFTTVCYWNLEIRLTIPDLLPTTTNTTNTTATSSILSTLLHTLLHPNNSQIVSLQLLISCYLPPSTASTSSSTATTVDNIRLAKYLYTLYSQLHFPFPQLQLLSLILPYPPLSNTTTSTTAITTPVTPIPITITTTNNTITNITNNVNNMLNVIEVFDEDEALNTLLQHTTTTTTNTTTNNTIHTTNDDSDDDEEIEMVEVITTTTTTTATTNSTTSEDREVHTLSTCYDMLFTSILTQQSNAYNPHLASFGLALGYATTLLTSNHHHHHHYRYNATTTNTTNTNTNTTDTTNATSSHSHHYHKISTSSSHISKQYDGLELVRTVRNNTTTNNNTNAII